MAVASAGGGGGVGRAGRWKREREPEDLYLDGRERLREIKREPEKPKQENWREKRNMGKIGIFPRLIGLPRIP